MKLGNLISAALLSSTIVPCAFALPVFSENRALKTTSGAVLYPDSEDPTLVYYFPGQAQLVKDESNLRSFSLVHWGLSKSPDGRITYNPKESGGFLSFMAELRPTPSQLEEITARIGAQMHIALLPVQESTLEIDKKGTFGQKFFEEINIPSHGGQADAYIGVNATLTGLGATAMIASMKGQQSLMMKYCYQTLGLSPVFKGNVTLNWSTVYETIKTSFSNGSFFWKSEVSTTIQKLIRNGTLQINIVAAPDSEAKYEEFVMKMANMLAERMFKNEVPASTGSGNSGGLGIRVSLDYGRSEMSENINISFSRSEIIKQNFCVPISLKGTSEKLDAYVISADGVSVLN